MQTLFTAEQLQAPSMRASEKILRTLRALRLLHRDLPDLRAARRRARQPARAHLPDEADAGERQAARGRHRQAHRPLPLLPLLHDHLPVRRALHASGRPRPRLHRGDTTGGRWPTGWCAGCCSAPSPIRGCSAWRCSAPRSARPFARPAAGAAADHAGAGAAHRCPRPRRSTGRRSSPPRASAARGWRCSPAARSRCWRPQINEATIRLLTRLGVEVVVPKGMGCCGALTHHMGKEHVGPGLRQGQHRRLDARARAAAGSMPW